MIRKGRPPETMLRPKYPVQEHIRKALNRWVETQPTLREAAAEMQCTYRLLSAYRHGRRWIPDRIVQALGFDPMQPRLKRVEQHEEARAKRDVKKHIRESQVISAAVRFAKSFKDERLLSERLFLRSELLDAVQEYEELKCQ